MADELFDRKLRGLTPQDTNDPTQFGQILECTKDAFVQSLRNFFDEAQVEGRRAELPTVEKYTVGYDNGLDPFLTAVEIVQEYPDILERIPHISVTSGGASNRRMNVGTSIVSQPSLPPRVIGTGTGPFNLSATSSAQNASIYVSPAGAAWQTLRYRTQPKKAGEWVESQVVFKSNRFANIASATADDVARVINEQALYARARVTSVGTIELLCGGPAGGFGRPNRIEILGTSTATLLTSLGLTAGQQDSSFNTARPPSNRYHMASQVTVNIDVLSADVNSRREIADLVYGWATFWMERDYFQIQGRSWTSEDVNSPEEWWHVILHQEANVNGPQDVPRPGDQKDKVHIQRITVPVTTFMYIDRQVRKSDKSNFILQGTDLVLDGDLTKPS